MPLRNSTSLRADEILPCGNRNRTPAASNESKLKGLGKLLLRHRTACAALRRRHRNLSESGRRDLLTALTLHFFSDPKHYPGPLGDYLATPEGQADLSTHMTGRLDEFRFSVIPWLNSIFPLAGSPVMEVGCGTGASTVALAEQGAHVLGVDVSGGALEVARIRCECHETPASLRLGNAVDLETMARPGQFDAVIFFASLEHMTWEERRLSLHAAWNILQPGQYLIVIETPNRLWHTDTHTSLEPFFHWLPHEIALPYSRLTRRRIFNEAFRHPACESATGLARWGRGVSFHDLVLSLEIAPERLPVVSSMQAYLRPRRFEQILHYSASRRYERFLQSLAPDLPPGLTCRDLYIALRKPAPR